MLSPLLTVPDYAHPWIPTLKMHKKNKFSFKTPSHTEQAVIVSYLFPNLRKEVTSHVFFVKLPALYFKVALGYLEQFVP